MTQTLTELTGKDLFDAVMSKYTYGDEPPDPLGDKFADAQTALSDLDRQPSFRTHGKELAELEALINPLTAVEHFSRRVLTDRATQFRRQLQGNKRDRHVLEKWQHALEADRRALRALDQIYPGKRLRPEALGLSFRQTFQAPAAEGSSVAELVQVVVPRFAVVQAGRRSGNPRCILTIRAEEQQGRLTSCHAITSPDILSRYWTPTEKPRAYTRQSFVGRSRSRKSGRFYRGAGGALVTELSLSFDFKGVLPADIRARLPLLETHFGERNLFLVAEATAWESGRVRPLKVLFRGDPIILGVRRLANGEDAMWAAARFDVSTNEARLLEHTYEPNPNV